MKIRVLNQGRQELSQANAFRIKEIISMGEEAEREQRLKDLKGYQVNSELLSVCKDDVIVMHCLPAKRGQEITDEVMDSPHSVVFDEAENRLHMQKAILVSLITE